MKIAPINNYTQQNNNFKGKFLMSPDIREIVNLADRMEMLRFKKALKMMNTVDDNLIFSVTSRVKPCWEQGGTIIGYSNIYEFNKQEGYNSKTKQLIGSYITNSDNTNSGVLSCITDKLVELYKGFVNNKTREELKTDIYGLLV